MIFENVVEQTRCHDWQVVEPEVKKVVRETIMTDIARLLTVLESSSDSETVRCREYEAYIYELNEGVCRREDLAQHIGKRAGISEAASPPLEFCQ